MASFSTMIRSIFHNWLKVRKFDAFTRSYAIHWRTPALVIILAFFMASGAAYAASQENAPHALRSPVNTGGPEDWPEDEGLSTNLNGQNTGGPVFNPYMRGAGHSNAQAPAFAPEDNANMAESQSAPDAQVQMNEPAESLAQQDAPAPVSRRRDNQTRVDAEGAELAGKSAQGNIGLPMSEDKKDTPPPQEREVIYVDEAGNPVEKPLDPVKMLEEANAFMDEGKYDDALPILERIKTVPGVPRDILEKALYNISDCQWARYADNPLAGYEPIISATNEALNANLRSPRVPDALLRLGLANINVGNLGDAGGYIVALMRRFPDFPGVAQGFTSLGVAQLEKGKNAEAEQSFGIVLDKYPESSQLQAASVGLAKALVNQKKDERAQVILEFISKRWPRYYINDPDFLLMQAANDEKLNRDDEAMALHWLYVNLEPKREANAPLLLKMGDKYMRNGNTHAANFVYEDIEQNFPDSPSAITARLRLAEKGIYDAPVKYNEMSRVFDKGNRPTLWQVYNELAEAAPEAPEAILARLKQAMWLYWDKQYPEAMGKAADFIDNYPENSETPEARDILWMSFQKEMEQSLAEHNYGRILLLWNGFPYVRERYGKMDAPLRYALAQGWLERGDEAKSFELLGDFLKDPMDPNYGEAAFSQFFNRYLQDGAWDKILDLGNLVKNWHMKPELQNQLDYALALSAQNLNLGAPALNRWKQLSTRTDIPLYQQAYANYFLAKEAESRRDIRNAYEGNRKVVEMFTRLADERSDKANPDIIKECIASLMDICEVGNRVPEAMDWVDRYSVFVGEDSPEFPALRFREARLYRKLGDSAKSQALLEDIARRFPESPFGDAASAELRTFDVSRDLEKFISQPPASQQSGGSGTQAGNWSSSGPAAN